MQQYFSKKRENNRLVLSKTDIHHIKNVMRMKNKDNVIVVHDSVKYLCEVDIDNLCAIIVSKEESNTENRIKISIAQGLIREQKLDVMLKMCTELGMYEYYPVVMKRSVVKLDRELYTKKVNRWRTICKESAEQCHRDFIPIINEITTIEELAKKDFDIKIICSTNKNLTNIKNILQNVKKCGKMLMVIGPEGGIDPEEEKYLIENGFTPVSLGNRILRTETVPVYINSIIDYCLME